MKYVKLLISITLMSSISPMSLYRFFLHSGSCPRIYASFSFVVLCEFLSDHCYSIFVLDEQTGIVHPIDIEHGQTTISVFFYPWTIRRHAVLVYPFGTSPSVVSWQAWYPVDIIPLSTVMEPYNEVKTSTIIFVHS